MGKWVGGQVAGAGGVGCVLDGRGWHVATACLTQLEGQQPRSVAQAACLLPHAAGAPAAARRAPQPPPAARTSASTWYSATVVERAAT